MKGEKNIGTDTFLPLKFWHIRIACPVGFVKIVQCVARGSCISLQQKPWMESCNVSHVSIAYFRKKQQWGTTDGYMCTKLLLLVALMRRQKLYLTRCFQCSMEVMNQKWKVNALTEWHWKNISISRVILDQNEELASMFFFCCSWSVTR